MQPHLPDEALLPLYPRTEKYEVLLLFHLQKSAGYHISEFPFHPHLCFHLLVFYLTFHLHLQFLFCLPRQLLFFLLHPDSFPLYLRLLLLLHLDKTRELFTHLLQIYLPLSGNYPDILHPSHFSQQNL